MTKTSWNCFSKNQTIKSFMGNTLRISAAPDPTEIFWENLGVSTMSRVKRVIVGLLIDFFLVFGCGLSIYFLQDYQNIYAKNHNVNSIPDSQLRTREIRNIQLLSFAISIIIFVINQLLVVLVKVVADFKKLQTRTNYNLSFAFFLSLAQFTNATLVPLVVAFIVHENTSYQMLYGASGLIPTQNTIFMVNSFLPTLFFVFDIPTLIKKFLRKKQEECQKNSILTQQELLELYEDPEFTIQTEYSQIMKTLLMTLFYATPLPICIFWSILGLIIQYFIAKYNLLYRRSAPFNMGSSLAYKMVLLINVGLVIFACLSYVFIILSQDDNDNNPRTVSFFTIAIAVIHLFLPIHIINNVIFKIKSKKPENTKKYQEVQGSFSTDYDRTNPATRRQANQKFVEEQEAVVENAFQQKTLINLDQMNKAEAQGMKQIIQFIEENTKLDEINNETQVKNQQESQIQNCVQKNVVKLHNDKNDNKDDQNLHIISLKDEGNRHVVDIKNNQILFKKNEEEEKLQEYHTIQEVQKQNQEIKIDQISLNMIKYKQIASISPSEKGSVIKFEEDQ
ncbi:hypothetical protein ABPG74_006630 [Tetrahymena malaccensis]